MDNFAEENEFLDGSGALGLSQKTLDGQEIDDISFEEPLNIEEIQKQLQGQMDPERVSENFEAEPVMPKEDERQSDLLNSIETKFEKNVLSTLTPLVEIDTEAKKYVVYIEQDNINFMESLSNEEKRIIVNKILREQSEVAVKRRKIAEKVSFMKRTFVAVITFIIAFPFMFIVVNKALEITMVNYAQAKRNFSKLYREQGKIKSVETLNE